MPKIKYADISLRKSSLALITQVNDVIDDYERQGYSLTLRQVYYQLVSGNIIPNSEKSYNNLGVLINNGRLAGLIDWNSIEDRTRYVRALTHWHNPNQIIRAAADSYTIDLWEGQDYYLEVWVEKDALIGIVEQTATEYDVPCFSCRGYGSTSEYWKAAQRFIEQWNAGRMCVIIHLGDHDPSGLDMTRDIRERLVTFGADVYVERIALNMKQIERYSPPPNPAKLTDTRAKGYIQRYGASSWELDALRPEVLSGLIRDHIMSYLDTAAFVEAKDRQAKERSEILRLIS